jgi:MOSC domain-containing protein YiiM
MSGLLLSVNVGRIETVAHHDRDVSTGIFKRPVTGRVATRGVNLDGDDQADRQVHGGPDRAVYAYAAEDLEWWADEVGRPLPAGSMGENLTTADVDVTNAVIGERWRIGSVVLEVAAPRTPCFKLGIAMGDGRFPPRFAAAGRPGAYLRIVEHGELGAGDAVTVTDVPAHGVTVALVAHAYHDDHSLAARLLTAPALGAGWPEWARRQPAD